MKFYLDAFMFPGKVEEFKSGLKFTGSDPERYQTVLHKLRDVAILADEGGIEGICFSEQHSNIEGVIEVSTNPLLLDAYLAGHTKRLKVGQLGLVLTANHPLRIAEDIALLDHISGGRAFCGFARGNAKRWVNTFSQHFGTEATDSDKSAVDEQNLRAVKEAWAIIKAAWTNRTFSHKGEFWTVPAENTSWNFNATAVLGGGMDPDGRLREIGCVPRPLQKQLPRLFTPLAFRMTTAVFWVSEGATAVCFASNDEFMQTAHRVLTETAEKAGRSNGRAVLAPGIFLMVGKTKSEAEQLRADYEWLFKFAYSVPPFNVPIGRVVMGTPDEVTRQIEDLQKLVPFEECFIWHNLGIHDDALGSKSIELFVEKVLPRFS
jgi:alkanesulfonate monooxygenase SsuD/methylene tetrahydromethanopterin reductase-like flavin-dependent oxidoreductase (luciferase family)